MSEKRHGMRRTIFYYLNVVDPETEKVLGRMGDISENGVLLITDNPEVFTHGKRQVKILLPPGLAEGVTELSIYIESRWVRQDKNPRYSLVGCSTDSNPRQRRTIESLIEHYAFSDGYMELHQETPAQ